MSAVIKQFKGTEMTNANWLMGQNECGEQTVAA